MPRSPDAKRVTLQTAERALRFLEAVASADTPPRVRGVADALGVNLTTAYHLFNTLEQAGYLVRDANGCIRLGSQVNVLYEGFRRQFSSTRDLMPFVEGLSKATRETAYLSMRRREGLVVQLQVETEQALRVAGHGVGFYGHEHVRASGKAVMAHMEPHARADLLERLLSAESAQRATAIRQRLETEFTSIREKGWALDCDEYQAGVCCVAAPFFGMDGAVAGSVSVSLPTARYREDHVFVTEQVVQAAHNVSRVHGHQVVAETVAG
ncbi:IclR family transcriptional regulator [Micromonosporaceae bacterium B7E4]